jgi:hypothetical protein
MINRFFGALALVSVLLPTPAKSIDSYKLGDSLYVWALSGLTLRKQPAPDADKIAVLSYGALAIPLNYTNVSLSTELIKPGHNPEGKKTPAYTLKGRWVEVKTDQGQGFIFDGYLSVLPPFKANATYKNNGKSTTTPWENKYQYLERVFGAPVWAKNTQGESQHNSQYVYAGGIYHEYLESSVGLSSWKGTYIFPQVHSLEEGYLLCNLIFDLSNRNPSPSAKEYDVYKLVEIAPGSLLFSSDGADVRINCSSGIVVISWVGSC